MASRINIILSHVSRRIKYPTKAQAKRAVDGLRLEINMEASSTSVLSVDELIEHYRQTELSDANAKTARTKEVYSQQLLKVISPSWGSYRLRDVKPIPVEAWLNKMQVAPGSLALGVEEANQLLSAG